MLRVVLTSNLRRHLDEPDVYRCRHHNGVFRSTAAPNLPPIYCVRFEK